MMSHNRLAAWNRRGMDGTEPETLRIWLLGGFRVSVGNRAVGHDRWRLKKAASLVKLLALARDHRMHRERVTDLLWPDLRAPAAANNLYQAIHAARRALEPQVPAADSRYLRLGEEQIELCRDGSPWVDTEVFEMTAASARSASDPSVHRAAADLYAGELLPGDLYEPWAEERRESLRQTYLSVLLEMARLHEQRGEQGQAFEALTRLVVEDNVNEEAHRSLMRLLALDGRRREALRQYERLDLALSSELGASPSTASRRLRQQIEAREPPSPVQAASWPVVAASQHPGNLPTPLTTFVGREREIIAVKRALSMTRLLTLTGAGGTGKTRLALELARELAGAYPQGAWLVELAPLSKPALVARAVAAALGVREQPGRSLTRTLCESLGSGRALLVLDNCEHLIDAAARFAKELLGACPDVSVLATSREALNVAGETVWPVPTLSLPGQEADASVAELMRCEAVRLFVDRARSRLTAFELSPYNAPSVAAICRKLDGIPLAIELSTARMGALAVENVAERLEDSLKLLTGGDRTVAPRHQTLRATLDWSHELLSGSERTLFARLSVFAGGFSLRAAETVGPGRAGDSIEKIEVLDLLTRLVDKSVVVVESAGDGGLRYGMLQPIRQYGLERLESRGEASEVRCRHAHWCFELARDVEPWLRGARREAWLGRLEREYGNLRAALDWALETGDTELGLWFGATLAEFWYISGRLDEGRRWLEAALDGSAGATPTAARVRALARAGWISFEQGDYERSVALSEECLALSRRLEDETGVVAALTNLSWAALLSGQVEKGSALADDATRLARALDDAGGIARALLPLSLATLVEGDHARALTLHDESLSLASEVGDSVATALSLGTAVFASLGLNDVPGARALLQAAFAGAPRPGVTILTAFHLHAAAALAGAQGHAFRAARLWSAAESLRRSIDSIISPVERRVYGPYIASARSMLSAAQWNAAWAEGEEMTPEEAVDCALAERNEAPRVRTGPPRAPSKADSGERTAGKLTRRQEEVALLVAQGLTNAQIAETLSISTNTAANHVAGIIRRLKLASRSQVAAWIAERKWSEAD